VQYGQGEGTTAFSTILTEFTYDKWHYVNSGLAPIPSLTRKYLIKAKIIQ
jgi:hypothetical protein